VVWDWLGRPLAIDLRDTSAPVSFVAARTAEVANGLLDVVAPDRVN
jgi:hypothetical protein